MADIGLKVTQCMQNKLKKNFSKSQVKLQHKLPSYFKNAASKAAGPSALMPYSTENAVHARSVPRRKMQYIQFQYPSE